MMGHASLRSTTTYARLSDMKISADMDALVKRRKEEGLSKKEVANQPKGSCRTLKKRLKITICKEEPKNNDELQDN
jgi:hypothetical protein